MYRHPTLDLGYTHETLVPVRQASRSTVLLKPKGLGLTARLRGLKALFDTERDRLSDREDSQVRAH